MDSVPSYRPASVPPPVIPSTPSPDDNSIPNSTLIGIGFILGISGLYMMLSGNLFSTLTKEADTPSTEKMTAMDAAKAQVIAENRPAVSKDEKLEYLNALQAEADGATSTILGEDSDSLSESDP